MDDRFREISLSRERLKQDTLNRYADRSRDQLKRNIETKIKTTMIGALALIEAKLGFLWGQGKALGQLSEQEKDMNRIKDELRTEILNNGNNQLRSAIAELNQYNVSWNKFQYDLKPGPEQRS